MIIDSFQKGEIVSCLVDGMPGLTLLSKLHGLFKLHFVFTIDFCTGCSLALFSDRMVSVGDCLLNL
jgi:hypothetical protein